MAATLENISTPLGDLVCERWDDTEHPGFNILLRPNSGGEILLAVAEFAKVEGKIKLLTYGDPTDDEPDCVQDIDENYVRICQEGYE